VLLAAMEQLGEEGDWSPGFASGFGGGIGRTGLVCGAITGAVIAAGSRYGRGSADFDRDKLYEISRSLVLSFTEEFGSSGCRELIGVDLTDKADRKRALEERVFIEKCARFVEYCADEVVNRLSG
jgi:C_GCAxxG_C_C family probable redox protein